MDGGFAEYAVADAGYTFALPERISDTDAAPLLCAGAIGYRAYRMIGEAKRLSIYGDGPTADLIAQIAAHQQRTVHRFADGADDTAPAAARCGDCGRRARRMASQRLGSPRAWRQRRLHRTWQPATCRGFHMVIWRRIA